MLKFRDVTLRRGGRVLFAGASFAVFPGQKVGITGANGTGKSSLFALLRGELQADAGDTDVPAKWIFAHVAQETPAVDQSAVDYVLDGDTELRAIEAAIRTAEQHDEGMRLAALHAQYDHHDGYTASSRAAQLLDGLGFATAQHAAAVRSFSGGWRMRLNLARALMRRSDVLLLDEPTNHLDLDAVLWLEDYLRAYPGALLLISHDREFLDRVVTAIVHLERETLTMYTGNYSSFEQQRIAQRAGQQAEFVRQQREIAHIRGYIDRFKTHASKARQAQSRMKALERMELIAPAHVDTPFRFGFRDPPKIPRPLLTLDEVAAGYEHHTVFADAKVQLVPGDRVGLLGPNGAGKSTLIKVLAGVHAVSRGVRSEPPDVRIGYFAQHQLEQLDGAASSMQHLQMLDPRAREQDLRNFVGGFGFSGDMAYAAVEQFSGGEKARLVLALLVYQRPNVLLLDEPTNHLDLEMRHALTMALQDFGGAMVIVSHDRFLLRSVTDRWLLVADGRVQEYDGEIEAYRDWLNQRSAARQLQPTATVAATATADLLTRKERKRSEAEHRQRQQPLRNQIKALEAKLDALTRRSAALAAQLEGDVYGRDDRDTLKELLLEHARVQAEVLETEEAWLAASESLQAGPS